MPWSTGASRNVHGRDDADTERGNGRKGFNVEPGRDRVALVTLDLDGTLLGSTVFQIVGEALGYGDRIRFVDDLYERGLVSLRTAWYAEYPLFLGVPVDRAHEALDDGDWVEEIRSTVEVLRERGHEVWVLTDQPDWAVSYLEGFGIQDGVYTRTSRWQDRSIGAAVDVAFEKKPALLDRLAAQRRAAEEVVHVGNGENDIPVFEAVGGAVAFNPSTPAVSEAAGAAIEADSLAPILDEIG
jgi:phosphoserine phosphatase